MVVTNIRKYNANVFLAILCLFTVLLADIACNINILIIELAVGIEPNHIGHLCCQLSIKRFLIGHE